MKKHSMHIVQSSPVSGIHLGSRNVSRGWGDCCTKALGGELAKHVQTTVAAGSVMCGREAGNE